MKLMVLGKYGPWPRAGSACSGYLLEAGGKRLLLDCGCGVLGKLQQHCAIHELDGVVLTHLHSDHMGDMMVLRYAMPYLMGKGLRTGRLPVFLPAAPENVSEAIFSEAGFDARTVKGGSAVVFMGMGLSFFTTRHPFACNAVKIRHDGKTMVYSGDMNTTPGFEAFAGGADLLLIDGFFTDVEWSEEKPHLSAALAAGIGRRAGVKRLLLTHFRPDCDEALLLAEAAQAYPGAEAAQEGAVYAI